MPIKDALKNGDSIFFHIETMDLWVNTDIHLTLMGRMVLQGRAQFKISKQSTFVSLRKKLQIFGIKLWCHKNKQPIQETAEEEKGSEAADEIKIRHLGSQNPLPSSNFQEETKQLSESFQEPAQYLIDGSHVINGTMSNIDSATKDLVTEQQHLLYTVDKFEMFSLFPI